jgi:pimeloyl-ACP methyl ester carboxylesterase
MKVAALILLIIALGLAIPYGSKTYGLKPISSANLPAEGAWAPLTQGNLYYRWYLPAAAASNGQTLVLVHGFSTPHFVWDGVWQLFLNAGYQILVYDHFGRGFSERPSVDYSAQLYVQALAELLDQQNLSQPVHLVGYSMGGAILGHFAEAHPERVKTMSLIAPAGFMTEQPASSSLVNLPLIGEWLGHMFADKMLVSDISDREMANIDDPLAMPTGEFVIKVGKQMQYAGFVESLVSTLRHFNLFNALESFNAVGQLGIPTLAIWGTDDATVPFMGSENLLLAIPHAELVVIEGGGHNITYMQPSIVGPAIVDFVGQNNTLQSPNP